MARKCALNTLVIINLRQRDYLRAKQQDVACGTVKDN
jgi:hypothetical protein